MKPSDLISPGFEDAEVVVFTKSGHYTGVRQVITGTQAGTGKKLIALIPFGITPSEDSIKEIEINNSKS